MLLGAVALVIYGETRPLERTFYGSVKDLLPTPEEVPGWTVQYLPIADTPEMQAKVNELLNYDDAVYAVYTKGTERISIYIAYWMPGKMSERLIAAHTPDVCWVGQGWKIVEAKSGRSAQRGDGAALGGALERSGRVAGAGALRAATDTNLKPETGNVAQRKPETGNRKPEMLSGLRSQASALESSSGLSSHVSGLPGPISASQRLSFSDFEKAAPAAQLFSALTSQVSGFEVDTGEGRLMERNGHRERVAFWHLSGSRMISYGTGKPMWQAAFAEATNAFQQRGEQVFVRISRNAQKRALIGI